MGYILWVNLKCTISKLVVVQIVHHLRVRQLVRRTPIYENFLASRNYSKPSDNTNTNEWSTGWNDDDNQSWVSGGGQSDASAITSRAPKTSAGNYYIRVGISFRNSCCNIKTSQQGQNDASAITSRAPKTSAGNDVIMSNLK
jgi:hypothetical protein